MVRAHVVLSAACACLLAAESPHAQRALSASQDPHIPAPDRIPSLNEFVVIDGHARPPLSPRHGRDDCERTGSVGVIDRAIYCSRD
jgi:hypothetical protein